MNYRSMPPDFKEHANEGFEALMEKYHAGGEVIRRWKQLCGTLKQYNRRVIRTDQDGRRKIFPNVKTAAKESYVSPTSVYRAIRTHKYACGYKWRYADE